MKEEYKMVDYMMRVYKLVHGGYNCPRCSSSNNKFMHVKNYEITTRCINCGNAFVA